MRHAIEVENLTKGFEGVRAVSDISFSVEPGELFGFLGPNGAGKTTTINILTGLARPDRGTVRIGDIDCTRRPRRAQHLIGVDFFALVAFCLVLFGLSLRNIRKHCIA
mgnify:CR=1 FL=1